MEKMINFGIDLGTTNSVIAKFTKGEVNIYKNPAGWKETLPSVIYFRKDKSVVGEKAKERWEKESKNVVARFKRKMGTNERLKIESTGQSYSPVELSSVILKELKSFVQDGAVVDAAVITIPASFDTVQSNATKQAGVDAGIHEVVLLQEPIAASLAYANQKKEKQMKDGHWLVYDLGGGTFDVALVRIQDGEMRVLDHEGNNFLGGVDFDQQIVEKILIPQIEKKGNFPRLLQDMTDAKGKYNGKFFELLYKAEQAKIELSRATEAEIELNIKDADGEELELLISISRSEFESLIRSYVDSTIEMIQTVIQRNKLTKHDIQFVLMVGGSTYVPYVRRMVGERTGIAVNCDIDPTTAVAVGAAYYAGNKLRSSMGSGESSKKTASSLKVKIACPASTQESEEFVSMKVEGDISGMQYQILRSDGGFDSGKKPLREKITEDLPLVSDTYNFFTIHIYDRFGNAVSIDNSEFGISHGKFMVNGQPLPDDISLEVDDLENERTIAHTVFKKNEILPSKRKINRTANRTVRKGTDDELIINVVEGPSEVAPGTNKQIGCLIILGKDLKKDLYKGSDVEITLDMTESRDLTISVYLPSTGQDFSQTFQSKERGVNLRKLRQEVNSFSETIERELREAEEEEQYEKASKLKDLRKKNREIAQELETVSENDVTDKRYQLEDDKRKLMQDFDQATRGKKTEQARREYEEQKQKTWELVDHHGTQPERQTFEQIISLEEHFLSSENPSTINRKTEELHQLEVQILWRVPEFLIGLFKHLAKDSLPQYEDQMQAMGLAQMGVKAIQAEDWPRLRDVNMQLLQMLPRGARQGFNFRGTGI